MIKLLVVDDDAVKRDHIISAIRSIPELLTEEIAVAADLVAARDLLSRRFFDLVVLDILLPATPGATPRADAGIQFVRELGLSTTLIKPAHVIGLTAYDSALVGADQTFADAVWKLIKYDVTVEDWQRQLKSKILYLLQCKREVQSGPASYDYDLAILTALWNPELKAILDLPLPWEPRTIANDATQYYTGVSQGSESRLRVAAAACNQMGIAPAAVLATKLIQHFRPRYLAICGIAAGVKGAGVHLGDVLVVEQSWDYESGKRRLDNDGQSLLHPDPHFIPVSAEIRNKFAECVGKNQYVSEIETAWAGAKPFTPLKAVLGPLASGAAVIEDCTIVNTVKGHARKLIGIDMEVFGCVYAAENCCRPRPSAFAIKSVVDFADESKDDSAQEYAAYTSAQYLWRFAAEYLAPRA